MYFKDYISGDCLEERSAILPWPPFLLPHSSCLSLFCFLCIWQHLVHDHTFTFTRPCWEVRPWTVMSYDDVWTLTFYSVYSLFILWNTKWMSLYYSQYRTILPSDLSFETEVCISFSYVQRAVANQYIEPRVVRHRSPNSPPCSMLSRCLCLVPTRSQPQPIRP